MLLRYLAPNPCANCSGTIAVNYLGAWICQACGNWAWGTDPQAPGPIIKEKSGGSSE